MKNAGIVEQQKRNFTSTLVIKTLGILKQTLDQGFTTIHDCGVFTITMIVLAAGALAVAILGMSIAGKSLEQIAVEEIRQSK